MEGNACLSCLFTNSEAGGFEAPDVQEKNTQLSFESPKKKKVFFLASLKGQVRECLQIPVLVLKDMFLFSSEGITISEYDLFIFEPKKHT